MLGAYKNTKYWDCISYHVGRAHNYHETRAELHYLLPPPTTASQHYNLRCTSTHNRQLPARTGHLTDGNFITRLLYKTVIEFFLSQCDYLLCILPGVSLLSQQCVLILLILKKWMNEWMHRTDLTGTSAMGTNGNWKYSRKYIALRHAIKH